MKLHSCIAVMHWSVFSCELVYQQIIEPTPCEMILIIQPVCIQNIMLFSGASYNIKYTSYSRKISLSMMDTLVC